MIGRFLGDAFEILSCPFWNTVLQFWALLLIHTSNYWTVYSQWCPFSNMGVCLGVTVHIVDLWQHLLYNTRCKTVLPLYGALPVPYVAVRVTRIALVAHRFTYSEVYLYSAVCMVAHWYIYLAAEPRSTAGPSLSGSLRNDHADSVFDGVALAGFQDIPYDTKKALSDV